MMRNLCARFHIPAVYGLLVFAIRLNTTENFCVARFLQNYFINISDIFFKVLVVLPLCQDPKYLVLVALCHTFMLCCYYIGSKYQEHSTWVTVSGMTVTTSSTKVQNLRAGEEYGPCGNNICFIIFFFHFRKEHWKERNILIFGQKCY